MQSFPCAWSATLYFWVWKVPFQISSNCAELVRCILWHYLAPGQCQCCRNNPSLSKKLCPPSSAMLTILSTFMVDKKSNCSSTLSWVWCWFNCHSFMATIDIGLSSPPWEEVVLMIAFTAKCTGTMALSLLYTFWFVRLKIFYTQSLIEKWNIFPLKCKMCSWQQ